MSKIWPNFETEYRELEIIRIDFDDIWQKYSKDSRIEFASSFFINFLSFKPDTENSTDFDSVSSKCANFLTPFSKEDRILKSIWM